MKGEEEDGSESMQGKNHSLSPPLEVGVNEDVEGEERGDARRKAVG